MVLHPSIFPQTQKRWGINRKDPSAGDRFWKIWLSKPALEVGVLEKIVIRPPQQVFRPNFPKPVTSGRVFAHVTVATVVISTD